MSDQPHGAGDDVVVLPPLPADPVFVAAVDDAIAGEAADLPGAQPERRIGADPHDFASLYIRHRSSFALHARRFLNDPRDVEEVLQEAFLRLFLAMPELDTELQALAYCRRTVTNLCIDRYRADARRPRLLDLGALPVEPSDGAAEDDPVLRAEDAAIVREALALLSPLHREALIKREIEEKPLAQIAAELDVPEDSVKHLLHRARRALRRLLVGTTVEPGVDLSNTEMLRIANERLAKATLRGANVLIAVFVVSLVVVGGFAVRPPDQVEGSGELTTPAVTPPLTGAATDPAHAALTPAHAQKSHPRHRSSYHQDADASAPAPAPAAPAVASAPVRHAAPHTLSAKPAPKTATLAHKDAGAPVASPNYLVRGSVRATGPVAIANQVRVNYGTTASTSVSDLSAPVDNGVFVMHQALVSPGDAPAVMQLTPQVTTDNETTALPVASTQTAMTLQPDTQTYAVQVDATLAVGPTPSEPASVQASLTYDATLQHVLAETVTVTGVAPGEQPVAAVAAPPSPATPPATLGDAPASPTGQTTVTDERTLTRKDDSGVTTSSS